MSLGSSQIWQVAKIDSKKNDIPASSWRYFDPNLDWPAPCRQKMQWMPNNYVNTMIWGHNRVLGIFNSYTRGESQK
jgi:hypothetical protein